MPLVGEMDSNDSLFRKIPFICLGVAVPSLVLGRSVMAVMMVAGVIAFAFSRPTRRSIVEGFRRAPSDLLFFLGLIMFLSWVPDLFESRAPLHSVQTCVRTVVFVAAFAPLLFALKNERLAVELMLRAMVGAIVAFAAFAIFTILVSSEYYWFIRLRGWNSMSARTELKGYAALAVLVVPTCLWAAFRWRGIWRLAALAGALAFLLLVWLTLNRAAIAGLMAALAVAAVLVSGRMTPRRRLLLAVGGLVAVGVVSYWLFHVRAPVVAPEGDWMFPTWLIDYERQTMWRHVWRIAWEAPWFGIGANTINLTPGADVVIPGTNDTHVIPSHPHNWMIEVFAETGLVGLLSLCGFVGLALWRVVQQYRAVRNPAWLAAATAMTGYWTSGLFNFSLWVAWWQVSLLVTMAACVAGGLDTRTTCNGAEVETGTDR